MEIENIAKTNITIDKLLSEATGYAEEAGRLAIDLIHTEISLKSAQEKMHCLQEQISYPRNLIRYLNASKKPLTLEAHGHDLFLLLWKAITNSQHEHGFYTVKELINATSEFEELIITTCDKILHAGE